MTKLIAVVFFMCFCFYVPNYQALDAREYINTLVKLLLSVVVVVVVVVCFERFMHRSICNLNIPPPPHPSPATTLAF